MLLVVGLPAEVDLLSGDFDGRRRSSDPSLCCRDAREDLRNVLAMSAAGKVKCRVSIRPLSDASEVLGELRRGQVSGRVVLQP